MDDQGGAGGVPLHDGDGDGEARHRRPRAHKAPAQAETTRAADTDEASRLDRPAEQTEPRARPTRWTSPADRNEKGEDAS